MSEPAPNPLDELPFPVCCAYPGCGDGPFHNGIEVDEHITAEHLPEAVWTFAAEQMRPPADEPHTSDCPHWVGEACRCVTGGGR